MITLYGWGPMFDCPSPSPYVMKTEIQLQMLGVEFNRAFADLESVPKRKAPYLRDGDQLIQDSNFIRAHFEDKLGVSLDDGLSAADRAAGWALERMVEGHLSRSISWERWMKDANFDKGPRNFFIGVPASEREMACKEARAGLALTLHGDGFGRHNDAERMQLADWDIHAVALQLADKDYLFGDKPSAADASVSAFLISAATQFFDTPLSGLVRKHDNLMAYTDRMQKRYFAVSKWPVLEMAM